MLRIAVCDDDHEAVQFHIRMMKTCLEQCRIPGDISSYTDSHNLLCDIMEDHWFFDLLLLDIEMPGVTGMEIAEKIRPYLPEVRIIFITSHIEYAIDAFELSIFRYVPKDDAGGRLSAAIQDAIRLLVLEDGRSYTIRTSSRMEKIPYKTICYLERDGKNTAIITDKGTSRVRKSLQQVYTELDSEEFIYIDRGCIVNMIQIMQIHDGMAVLKSGVSLPVSRSHLQTVKEQINQYWGDHI